MSLHEDLLEQAVRLATLDARKPKQANLRRAVSSAYYAVFHLLVDEACRILIGTQHNQAPFRQVLGRAFAHGVMKEACKSFGGGTLKKGVAKGLPVGFAIPGEIRELALTFADLQEWRHLADYDRSERFKRSETLTLINQVKKRIEGFTKLPSSNEKRFFLACLWAWKELANR
ncbi:MAG TPA: hypothetical protein VFF52_07645 [Isosphaeraceae bacterium]|nr:hypothetical protein [Isosphaeraceae bacterium]